MKRLGYAVAAAGLMAAAVGTAWAQGDAERPGWAYPTAAMIVANKEPGPAPEGPQHMPGSSVTYTVKQTESAAAAADWYPDRHPPMPKVVADGDGNGGWACGACHTPSGFGHPESASLAGLSHDYILRTLHEFKDGERNEPIRMTFITKATSDADLEAAATWFASLKPATQPWTKVVETTEVPKTFIGAGRMRFVDPDAKGATEPLGQRIIEVPEDVKGIRLRDPTVGFIAYVPPGSIARGKALVETGQGKTIACATCHGPGLKGVADFPGPAGNHPIYIVRQLMDFKSGARNGPNAALMKPVVANLTQTDIIDLAAYIGSLKR